MILLSFILLMPVKTGYVEKWKRIPSPNVVRELGFGKHHLINFSDSIHFTIYPQSQHKRVFDTPNF